MDQPASTQQLFFPFKWVANLLVATLLFVLVALTPLIAWEYLQLSTVEGDAGYPFGVEEAGSDYATKEIYLERSRWIMLFGGLLSTAMIVGLLRRKMAITWAAVLVTLALLFVLYARNNA